MSWYHLRFYALNSALIKHAGVQFAETSMLLTMASILAKFDIRLPAQSTPPNVEFTSGITR